MINENPIESATNVISNDEKTWATLVHLSALTGLILPIFIIIVPLFIWLLKRKSLPFVDEQGKEALNFQITMAIGYIICIPLMFILIGFFLVFIVGVVDLIMVIIAAVHANRGEHYRYPFNWRVIH